MASHITIETLLRFPQLWQKIHFELLSTTCTSNGNNKLQHCVKDASSFKKNRRNSGMYALPGQKWFP